MRNSYFFCFALTLSLACCKNEQSGTASTPPATPAPAAPAAQPAAPAVTLPSIPFEKVKKLFDECSTVDYIFYDLPMSMSLDEKASIQYAVRHIASDPAPLNPACKPMGRVNYQVKGNIEVAADFYFSEGCHYFVFMENQKPVYANYMTEEGAKYFENQVKKGIQLRQGQGQ